MKKPFNMQLSSPEADRKVAWWASVSLMILAWLFIAACLALWVIAMSKHRWGFLPFIVLACLIVPLVLIPIQLIRYFREKRTPR
jgi:membrane protein YdbS with pleckstrin-like domain